MALFALVEQTVRQTVRRDSNRPVPVARTRDQRAGLRSRAVS